MNLNENRGAVVITDASCLIILEKIALSNILHQLFSFVITTPEIADEYGRHLPEWIVVVSVKDKSLQQRFSDIVDSGEASHRARTGNRQRFCHH